MWSEAEVLGENKTQMLVGGDEIYSMIGEDNVGRRSGAVEGNGTCFAMVEPH